MLKKAIVMGATGLVGRHLLHALAASGHYAQIIAITRRPDGLDQAGIQTLIVPDFSQLDAALATLNLQGADAFSTLGTTLKQAGSKARFRQVDYGYTLTFARACLRQQAKHFLLLSAAGASAQSMVFYNQIKGEIEQDLSALHFNALSVFQPSLLLGEHADPRLGEYWAQRAFGVLKPLIPQTFSLRPIEAERVAQSMCQVAITTAMQDSPRPTLALPVRVYSNADMLKLTLETVN
jgi:uncharacterized protein YbjT (DUF2867 family)